jgi:hypothetical protein
MDLLCASGLCVSLYDMYAEVQMAYSPYSWGENSRAYSRGKDMRPARQQKPRALACAWAIIPLGMSSKRADPGGSSFDQVDVHQPSDFL